MADHSNGQACRSLSSFYSTWDGDKPHKCLQAALRQLHPPLSIAALHRFALQTRTIPRHFVRSRTAEA